MGARTLPEALLSINKRGSVCVHKNSFMWPGAPGQRTLLPAIRVAATMTTVASPRTTTTKMMTRAAITTTIAIVTRDYEEDGKDDNEENDENDINNDAMDYNDEYCKRRR